MSKSWLLENADIPIKYNLTKETNYIERLFDNYEVKLWFSKLSDRVNNNDLSNIHGSHDYRYDNIIGKCFILGLNKNIPRFDELMIFFINFLKQHINEIYDDKLTFGKMYQYRDYETILACYMPFLGYAHESSVQYVALKRADILYNFTKQNRYDIYCKNNHYPGAKKEWQPYIVNPELYKDGNIALPSIHDLILFAGIYQHLNEETRVKIETIVKWLFNEKYNQIHNCLYYYVPEDPLYKSKGINSKIRLMNFNLPELEKGDIQGLLFHCFILSHFAEARKSEWFSQAVLYLKKYKTESEHFIFPRIMINEQKDTCVYNGGHMNIGEPKNKKSYAEIISTYWMDKIQSNLKYID